MSQVVNINERLAALTAAGTSVWLDQIRRSLTEGGELRRLVEEDSLRGVTSNPAIFEKAILGSNDYDEQIERLAQEGLNTRSVYQDIVIQDVQDACDVMRPVFDESGGVDGFVSLEVDPDLAFDHERTIAQAREYWGRVDRPNVMIKIPGTPECLPAIEQGDLRGHQRQRHAAVRRRGVRRRRRGVHPRPRAPPRRGALARRAVRRVLLRLARRQRGRQAPREARPRGSAGPGRRRERARRVRALRGDLPRRPLRRPGGAPARPVQRPLWASTGVKNPAYPDTKYVDELVGPDTVNTMPMQTLMACAERLEVRGETVREDPAPVLDALAEAGIDMDDVTSKLLRDGIDAFVTPMEKLLAGIEAKREAIFTGRPETIDASLPFELEGPVAELVRRAEVEQVARRIWKKDPTLWGPRDQPEVADRLGWLQAPETYAEEIDDLEAFAAELAAEGYTDAVLLGMGGSSLAPEVLRLSFGERQHGRLRLQVLDSTDPGAILAVERSVTLEHTIFVVSTKSGGTIETMSLYEHFWSLRPNPEQYVAITDPGSSLAMLAADRDFRRTFLNDPDVGGRYSALTFFGLVPAALMGVDLQRLLDGAGVAAEACAGYHAPECNSGLWLGCALGAMAIARPRQADVRRRRPDRVVRAVGRAARRRVHGQAGQGRAARRRRAGRARRTSTAPIASSTTCATRRTRTSRSTSRSRRSPPPTSRP